MKKIIVDLLGADHSEEELLDGALAACAEDSTLSLILVGSENLTEETLRARGADLSRMELLTATDAITGEDAPMSVVRGREGASMAIAFSALKDREDAAALVSAGNTGAMLIASLFRLGLVPGVRRPALATALLTTGGERVCLLDCGANVDCRPELLEGFAYLGAAFSAAECGKEKPRVGLFSVGKEEHKGNAVTHEVYDVLKKSNLNFIGNVEGYDVFSGDVDVVVCDGFVGNAILKVAESVGKGAAAHMAAHLRGKAEDSVVTEAAANTYRMFDYNTEGGAVMLGTKKVVLKAHGAATAPTLRACILEAKALADADLPGKITALLGKSSAR